MNRTSKPEDMRTEDPPLGLQHEHWYALTLPSGERLVLQAIDNPFPHEPFQLCQDGLGNAPGDPWCGEWAHLFVQRDGSFERCDSVEPEDGDRALAAIRAGLTVRDLVRIDGPA